MIYIDGIKYKHYKELLTINKYYFLSMNFQKYQEYQHKYCEIGIKMVNFTYITHMAMDIVVNYKVNVRTKQESL